MADDSAGALVVYGKRRAEVGDQHPVVQLKAGGMLVTGWKTVEIQKSIETLANGFALTLSDEDPKAGKLARLAPGTACELLVDGNTDITGYIDDSGPEWDADTHTLKIAGHDKAADMVDCAAYVPGLAVPVWAEGQPVLQIAQQIAAPFKITVRAEVDPGTAQLFALQLGETAFTALDRLAKEAGVLPISDGVGGIVLTRGGLGSHYSPLIEGKNILAAQGHDSWRNRFSDYYVFADSAGIYVSATPDAHMGLAKDPAVGRWRPTFVTVDFGHGPSTQKLNDYATWLMTVAAAKAFRPIVVSQGWKDFTGLDWQPNGIVPVRSPKLGCDEDLLIVSTRKIEDEQGTRTELGLTRPDAFKLLPLDSTTDYIVPGAPS